MRVELGRVNQLIAIRNEGSETTAWTVQWVHITPRQLFYLEAEITPDEARRLFVDGHITLEFDQ
jgi:hypothetical protein